MEKLLYAKTDWLASRPVFYNQKTGAISYSMNDCIDWNNFKIDAEGLYWYLKFGYSVFGHTMVEDVRFLLPDSEIFCGQDGKVEIRQNSDSAMKYYGKSNRKSSEVFQEILDNISVWLKSIPEKSVVILPLSGGLDSRILAMEGAGDERIHAYSYGYSKNQRESYEVVKAYKVAQATNIRWQHISLADYYSEQYMDRYYSIYGAETHLHGMYQMEFYDRILDQENANQNLSDKKYILSGIIGDGWAGAVHVPHVTSVQDISKIGYTHGMCIDDDVLLLKHGYDLASEFLEEYKYQLREENWRIIFAMRFKMMLLSYLVRTPEIMGMISYAPFLQEELAMDMLNLPWNEKEGRKWQHIELEKRGLDIGWEKKACDYNDSVNEEIYRKYPLKLLNEAVLGRVISKDYIRYINSEICKPTWRYVSAKPRTIKNIYNKMVTKHNESIMDARTKWRVLSSVERLLAKAERLGGL